MKYLPLVMALLLQVGLMGGYAHAQRRDPSASFDRFERFERQVDRANPGVATSNSRSAPTSQARVKRDRSQRESEGEPIRQPIR